MGRHFNKTRDTYVLKCGYWLKEFLEPELPNMKLIELFYDAVDLLQVNVEVHEDWICKYQLQSYDALGVNWTDFHDFYVLKKFSDDAEYFNSDRVEKWGKSFFTTAAIRVWITDFFKILENSSESWASHLSPDNNPLEIEGNTTPAGHTVPFFLENMYYLLGQQIISQNNTYVQKTCFLKAIVIKSERNDPNAGIRSVNRIGKGESFSEYFCILACRILWDFLSGGGQKNFGFCKYCNTVIISERANRRKTCSDTCRVALSRKNRQKNI